MIFRVADVSRTRLLTRSLAGLALLFSLAALPACQPSIEVLPPRPSLPLPVATVAPAEHSVAIIGVDFDPPLDYAQIIASGGLTLLVAIENRGLLAEPYLEATARLLDPDEADVAAVLLDETLIARDLAPGEIRVLRFTQVRTLPPRTRYELVVQLSDVPGDVASEDNVRRYDILVRDGAQ